MGPDRLTHATPDSIRANFEAAWKVNDYKAGSGIIQETLRNPNDHLRKAITLHDVAWVTRAYIETGIHPSPDYSGLFLLLEEVKKHRALLPGIEKGIVKGIRTLIESEKVDACVDVFGILNHLGGLEMVKGANAGIAGGVLNRASENPSFIRDIAFALTEYPVGYGVIPNAVARAAMFMTRQGNAAPLMALSEAFQVLDRPHDLSSRAIEKDIGDLLTNGISEGLRKIAGRNVEHDQIRALWADDNPAWQKRLRQAMRIAGLEIVPLQTEKMGLPPLTVIFHKVNPAFGKEQQMGGPVATLHLGADTGRTLPEMLRHLKAPYAHLGGEGDQCTLPSVTHKDEHKKMAVGLLALFGRVAEDTQYYPHFAKMAARHALEKQKSAGARNAGTPAAAPPLACAN